MITTENHKHSRVLNEFQRNKSRHLLHFTPTLMIHIGLKKSPLQVQKSHGKRLIIKSAFPVHHKIVSSANYTKTQSRGESLRDGAKANTSGDEREIMMGFRRWFNDMFVFSKSLKGVEIKKTSRCLSRDPPQTWTTKEDSKINPILCVCVCVYSFVFDAEARRQTGTALCVTGHQSVWEKKRKCLGGRMLMKHFN